MWRRGNKATLRDSLIATFVTHGLNRLGGRVSPASDGLAIGEGSPRGDEPGEHE
jgi:hypothetical protein